MSTSESNDRAMTCLGQFVVAVVILGCITGAVYMFFGDQILGRGKQTPDSSGNAGGPTPTPTPSAHVPDTAVSFGIAYGTEKKNWLKWAAKEWEKTDAGKRIRVNLLPMGSREGAQEVLAGNEKIHVWSPASALYKDYFVNEWQVKHGGDAIEKEEVLALSPMVFVFWKKRYDAFSKAYPEVSFATIAKALSAKGGWGEIAQQADWGFFKFGHTNPTKSNSGGVTLILTAYEQHGKTRDLTVGDVTESDFQQWLSNFVRAASNRVDSTGTLMKEMVLKGPSSFDALCVYENLAIDYLENAEGRWGQLHIVYPPVNMWNDNPYYILNTPWSSEDQKTAAAAFLEFLMTERIQKEALAHGFRPGNPKVGIKSPDSKIVKYAQYGIRIDLKGMCEPPKAEVISNLLHSWQRADR